MIVEEPLSPDPGLDPGMIVTVRPADDKAGRYRHSSQHSNRQSSDVQADPHTEPPAAVDIREAVLLRDRGSSDVVVDDVIADILSDDLVPLPEGSRPAAQRPGF